MANTENKQIPYESTQKDIRDEIGGVSGALKSTESTSRNIADILAEELARIAGHNASQVDYDNSTSQLSADDVQDAIDELASEKVDKVNGKGLSTNDYTDAEKTKLAGIEANAEVNVQSDWSQADSSADDYIKNKPSNLVQDASYVHTDNNFTNAEKTKLSGIENGAEVNVQSDWNQTDNTKDDFIKNKPSSEVKTATDTFTTVNGGLLEECNIELVPVQDLHGYDSPWVGGAGKNKFAGDFSFSGSISPSYSDGVLIFPASTVGSHQIALNPFTVLTDGTEYTLSFDVVSDVNGAKILVDGQPDNGTGSFIVDSQFTVSTTKTRITKKGTLNTDTTGIRFFRTSNHDEFSTATITISNIQLEFGSTATAYEPYENICPISGHTEVDLYNVGKNKFNPSNVIVGYFNNNAPITSFAVTRIIYAPCNPSETYTISKTAGQRFAVGYTKEFPTFGTYVYGIININNASSISITVGTDAKYVVAYIWNETYDAITADEMIASCQIELGSTATAYEPYLGHLYQVQIGQTVYGGSVDLVSGVMRVTHAKYILREANIQSGTALGSYVRLYFVPSDTPAESEGFYSHGIYKANYTEQSSHYYASSTSLIVFVIGETAQDAKDYIEAQYAGGKPLEIVYPIATPFNIQLTPQQIEALVGQNNLSTPLDGQSIDSVKYREVFVFDDVEKVVSLRVPISMLGTDESGRTTASQAYASGDYFYKDGYMCKALTSISAGATLTLNTNYSQGTLADILKAIENA